MDKPRVMGWSETHRFFKKAQDAYPEEKTVDGLTMKMKRLQKRRAKNKVAKQSRKKNRSR